ncbi:transcription factor TFIIIB component B' [Panicum miliaceum]|uniref:Transcription factor TFIIIB component B n=1 Tax=Panicum miliaceum TaxID=4540 RepID=A0A3L6PID7_PANMI|nr:transcription factor TFIIIB component B' [Panicum miliaceum]
MNDCVEPSLAEEDDNDDAYIAGAEQKVRKKSRGGVEEPQQQKVKTLLETPLEEIDPMKLSAAHHRLLQEARERVNAKEIPSGPSFNTSSRLEDLDDLYYSHEEARNFDNDRTENHVQNVSKLNYHSYMHIQTRAKWSKSDTDLFYQVLRQFGSDFAMIQQLVPAKTRHQVIEQLNIEDMLPEINNTHKYEGALNEEGPGNKLQHLCTGAVNFEFPGNFAVF